MRRNEETQPTPQKFDTNYEIVEVPNAAKKNCTGSANCIPKCFAEKGSRGMPGLSGLTGEKGISWHNIHIAINRFETKM